MNKKVLYSLFVVCLAAVLQCCSVKSEEGTPSGGDEETGTTLAAGYDVPDEDLPRRIRYSSDGLRLVSGAGTRKAYYDMSAIKRIDLIFPQSDWQAQMTANYGSETEIPASMIYDGASLAYSVGVRFKGNTSFTHNPTEKKIVQHLP